MIIGGLALALAACSAWRVGYGQGPELTWWWLERYVDFDETQEPRARQAIAEWFRWHRQTQLPDYAALLSKAQAEIAEPVTPAQVCRWTDAIQQRVDVAVEQALPPLADLLRAMTPQQIAHLERKYAKNMREFRRDFMQDDLQARREAQVKRVVERAETLYGRLSDPQRELVARLTAQSPLDHEAWAAERRRRQEAVLQTLRRLSAERASAEVAQAEFRRLYQEMFRSPREAYRAYQRRLVDYNCDFAAQLHNLATPEQRAAAVRRLKGWEDDARSLAASALRS